MGEEFEVVKLSGTRTDSSHSSASSDSTTPLSPDHPLTHVSPTPTPTRASFHRRTASIPVRAQSAMSLGTRTDSSHSSASLDSTTPLSPDHPLTHVSPTPTPTRALFYRKTARIPVCAQPAMSPGLSASMTKAMALSDSAFCKSDGDELRDKDTDEDGEDESLDADDERETWVWSTEALRVSIRGGSGTQYVRGTLVDPEDGRIYNDIPAYEPPVQTPPSPEWSFDSLPISPISPSSLVAPSPIASLVAMPTPPSSLMGINRDVREPYTRLLVVRYEIFLQRYRFRSLKRKQEMTVMTFGALWRPVLALEAWAGHVDSHMADMSRAGYDDHRLIHDMIVQQAALQRKLQEMRGHVTT
nr:hypothetical protein [Tanacetum cinerariifolium]